MSGGKWDTGFPNGRVRHPLIPPLSRGNLPVLSARLHPDGNTLTAITVGWLLVQNLIVRVGRHVNLTHKITQGCQAGAPVFDAKSVKRTGLLPSASAIHRSNLSLSPF